MTRLGAAMLMFTDVHETAANVAVGAPADGRAELEFTMRANGGARVAPNASAALVVGDFHTRTTGPGRRSDPSRRRA
ncbi:MULTISPECIES: hypothetical protein [Glycomyces]|uniref:Uncharacterized protein n=2 Tax=Glycomyces TaxID=58113 RepID=A0A9X3PIV5_9ACTN|nr:hypothetical protein [Glycomyces lechevalierae]MDA1386331.1 hypothetical protein [Glycomyces lechevalierae]MDR7338846.1 hypothetical protein [Glycomyces lechevalierae]